jgi:CRISPR-associated protein Cas2
MLFYDLPTITSADNKAYREFHSTLVKEGFIREQFSCYSKLVLNRSVLNSYKNFIRNNSPSEGIIQIFELTEKQYANIEYIIGQKATNILNTTERVTRIK